MRQAIHPSILAADFLNLQSELLSISSADAVHVDVMDNHFVPNLTFGLPVVSRIVAGSSIPVDVHLMISNVDEFAVGYADTGAASVTFHQEASEDIVSLSRRIRNAGSRSAIAVKPSTGIDLVLKNLHEFDMVLIMTVEPGFGGQRFIESTLDKVVALRVEIDKLGLEVRLQVDGGVNSATVKLAADAGADTFVAGSAIFSAENRKQRIKELREIAMGSL
jgi:ribulose-phosphate 3-epimerase